MISANLNCLLKGPSRIAVLLQVSRLQHIDFEDTQFHAEHIPGLRIHDKRLRVTWMSKIKGNIDEYFADFWNEKGYAYREKDWNSYLYKKIQALISNKIVTIVKQATDQRIISTIW